MSYVATFGFGAKLTNLFWNCEPEEVEGFVRILPKVRDEFHDACRRSSDAMQAAPSHGDWLRYRRVSPEGWGASGTSRLQRAAASYANVLHFIHAVAPACRNWGLTRLPYSPPGGASNLEHRQRMALAEQKQAERTHPELTLWRARHAAKVRGQPLSDEQIRGFCPGVRATIQRQRTPGLRAAIRRQRTPGLRAAIRRRMR